MSKVPTVLRNKLLQLALGFAVGATAYVAVDQPAKPSQAVQLAMELGAHYESSGRHIGVPYVDKLGKGQPLTVCNGVTGPEVVAGRYYSKDDCYRLELPKYLQAERAGKRMFKHWGAYNAWVQASFIDMIYNLGAPAVQGSTLLALANAGDLDAACAQMPRWVRGTVNGQSVRLPGLVDRRATTAELCRDWGRDGHFSTIAILGVEGGHAQVD
ncbi:lysozyme [Comamonas aquatica]|uniref:lysozyme n=1 Tax=Comamonas aquatica TaxID=225991 RepID=UPI00244C9140|nr:glycoside hydrolase family protein [Comamonas aquatica]MDH0494146.1 glycoside hydrolase family protein [Comamonas aquatica]